MVNRVKIASLPMGCNVAQEFIRYQTITAIGHRACGKSRQNRVTAYGL